MSGPEYGPVDGPTGWPGAVFKTLADIRFPHSGARTTCIFMLISDIKSQFHKYILLRARFKRELDILTW